MLSGGGIALWVVSGRRHGNDDVRGRLWSRATGIGTALFHRRTATPTTTTGAAASEACPPGCALPSDYDAITVLASSATLVATVAASDVRGSGSTASAVISVDTTLQGNPNNLIYPPTQSSLAPSLVQTGKIVDGGSYLVFMSYNRGGSCLAALFSFDPTTQVATLVENNDGPTDGIILPAACSSFPRRSHCLMFEHGCIRLVLWSTRGY